MQSRLDEIYAANGVVLGMSADSPFCLAQWAEKEGYTFPLLSDFNKETIDAYDNMFPELAGLKRVPKRSAFLIDTEGKLVRQEINDDAGAPPDLEGFIADLKAL